MSRKRRNPPYFFSVRRAVSPTALLFLVSVQRSAVSFPQKQGDAHPEDFGLCQKLDKIFCVFLSGCLLKAES